MKKSICYLIVTIFIISMVFFSFSNVKAASLDNIEAQVSKTKIAPGEEVTVTTNFGTALGAYTIEVAYDNTIFDYVSAEGGAANDLGTKVKLIYPNELETRETRTSASITFKAKESIVASNPTDFAITLEGLSGEDPSNTYDDITTPIKKDILVEPNYVDYSLNLQYEGTIEPNVAKDMKLITASSMGKNYDHVRLIADLTKEPTDQATAKLLATNQTGNTVDLLQNGWGEAEGYAIGGKDVKQELLLKGEFSQIGDYAVHVKLIDRDNSDTVIVEKTFNITVGEKKTENGDNTNKPDNKEEEKLPETLPKTGNTQYAFIAIAIITLAAGYYMITKENKKR